MPVAEGHKCPRDTSLMASDSLATSTSTLIFQGKLSKATLINNSEKLVCVCGSGVSIRMAPTDSYTECLVIRAEHHLDLLEEVCGSGQTLCLLPVG